MNEETYDQLIKTWKKLLDLGCETDILLNAVGQEEMGQELFKFCETFTLRLAVLCSEAKKASV